MNPPVTVYTQPHCMPCIATKKHLDRRGVQYQTVDITTDPAAADYVRSLGHQQSPVVVTPTTSWAGYRPDALNTLTQEN